MFERLGTIEAEMAVAGASPELALLAAADLQAPAVVAASSEGSAAEAWDRVRRRLRAELGEDVFSSWFARVELAAVTGGVAYLTVPTRFLKSWLEAHYIDRLRVNCAAELAAMAG
ncbi:MAG: DnaA N-terminal domain-containing protein, partial [Bosea sp. (in: a-proteobacteria)]